jgi:hypothetical protein
MIRNVSGLSNIALCEGLAVATDLEPGKGNLPAACSELLRFTSFLTRRYALTSPNIYSVVYLIHDAQAFQTLAKNVHQLRLDSRTLGYTVHDDALATWSNWSILAGLVASNHVRSESSSIRCPWRSGASTSAGRSGMPRLPQRRSDASLGIVSA